MMSFAIANPVNDAVSYSTIAVLTKRCFTYSIILINKTNLTDKNDFLQEDLEAKVRQAILQYSIEQG